MKRSILALTALLASAPLLAIDVDPKLDRATRAAIPVCGDSKLSWEELPVKLPPRFTGVVAKIDSSLPACRGELAAVLSPTGGFFLGAPWPIAGEDGTTVEQKLKNFTWRNLQENVTVVVDRKLTDDGLWSVTLNSLTEAGTLPMYGSVDPEGRVFFFGTFRRANGDIAAQRAGSFEKFLAGSPARGPSAAPVTIVEFSDFQCPSCRRASSYAEKILEKHPEKVRYVRYDVPLNGHPWAFPAALAGRAILRQKPELFWDYKRDVYENQDTMSAFMFWDWARGWAEDHGLDLAAYDADLASPELKKLILEGAGTAFSNDIRATPTYMVNGNLVEYGENGASLAAYVDKLLQ